MLGIAAAASASSNAIGAEGQPFPNRPLRIIAGFAAGGSTDIIARLVAQKLSEALQQPVVVENRTGANGNIAAEATVKAAPDGHTMLMAANGLTINASLYKKIPYDPVKDFSPITQVAFIPNVLVVHPSLPVRSVKEFIALARARPDQLTHGSSGTGSPGHLAGEVFKIMIIARLNSEIVKALRAPDFQERLIRDGAEPVGSTPEEFRSYIERDVGKWAKVIDTAGIRFEP